MPENLELEWLESRSKMAVKPLKAEAGANYSAGVSATTTLRDNYGLIIDVSAYQPKIEWQVIKAGGVAGVIARCSFGAIGPNYGGFIDSMFAGAPEKNIESAYANDIPLIAYHVLDPGYYMYKLDSLGKLEKIDIYLPDDRDEQLQTFLKAIRYKKIYGVAVDFELYKDWNGKTMTDGWLSEVARQFMIRVQRNLPEQPRYFYTGAWFINAYAPTIQNSALLVNLCDLWTAYYPYAAGIVNVPAWDQLKQYYPPNTFNVAGKPTQNPPFLGWDGWKLWQWSGDKFTLPGLYGGAGALSAVDLNFYNGTKEAFWKEIKFTPAVTPPPPPPPGDLTLETLDARLKVVEDKLSAIKAVL